MLFHHFDMFLAEYESRFEREYWIFGNFAEDHEDLRRRKGSAADQPHRLKYKAQRR